MTYKEYKLGDIVKIRYGKNQKAVECSNSDIPILGTGGIMGCAIKPLYSKPSVLIGRKGSISKVQYIDKPFWTVDTLFYTEVNEDITYPKYLYYVLSMKDLKTYDEGTSIPSLRTETLNKISIKIVSKEHQKQILDVIDPIENKINNNKKINDNLLQQVIASYMNLIVSFSWDYTSISDIAEKVAMGPFGSNIKVSTFVSEGVPIISGAHLNNYYIEEKDFNFITEEHAQKLKNSIVYPGDLIFTHAGNIGQVALIPSNCKYTHYMISQRQFYLRCNTKKVIPEFLLLFFHSRIGQHELLSYANQTGVPSIAQPASNLKKISFPCPPIETQTKWVTDVRPKLELYLNKRDENEKLMELRDYLLPKLLNGQILISN